MNEWLDIMLGEIARKTEEEKFAVEEKNRRSESVSEGRQSGGVQDKAASGEFSK